LLLLAVACAHEPVPPVPLPAPGSLEVVDANPGKGFHFPYILRMPDDPAKMAGPFLLVEPNNTGKISDDLDVHLQAARKLAGNAIGGYVAKKLNLPLLVPVFPRPETQWQIYTHLLDRDTLEIHDGPMRRLDLQLLAMIADARSRLRHYGLRTEEQVLMTGFSASGSFVNRFTMMHPGRVQAAATGGLNGLVMLPLTELDGVRLPVPLGLADLRELTGLRFRSDAWRNVPQFIHMGADDTNDAVEFDDGYSESERAIVHRAIGKRMQADRWERGQSVYREFGANAEFHTWPGVGHWTDGKINQEVAEFFRRAMGR
jgi:hypothetical protein